MNPLSGGDMIECLLVFYFLNNAFNQKWYFPQGIDYGAGRMIIIDSDRDGSVEFIFTTYGSSYTMYFYELHLPNNWEVDSHPSSMNLRPWDSGDFDNDGFYDLVIDCGNVSPYWNGITIFESPDSFSYPTQEVWRDTVDIGTVHPICTYDIDNDNIPEVVQTGGEPGQNYYIDFTIYESVGNSNYIVKYQFESPQVPTSTIAFGDFDEDGFNEFVMGTISGHYSIFESPGDDTYIPLFINIQLTTANITDCFTVSDMDGDGKLEFVVKGFTWPDARFRAFIFEATGDNTYQIKKTFVLTGLSSWDYAGGYSDAGDVDGDGIPEICLEACANVYIIKSARNDSFYVWQTLIGNSTGSCVRVTSDLDNNGLNEIVISGNNYTRIYEKVPIVTWFCPEPYDTFYANDTVYPRWKLDETISLDSLKLYWSHPQFGCHLIYQGVATDTIAQWVVPDTQSKMANRFWLVVKGLGRYDSTYSPVFYIKRPPGIEESEGLHAIPGLNLEVAPNPFRNATAIKFQIPNSPSPRIKYGAGSYSSPPRGEGWGEGLNSNLSTRYSLLATLRIYDATGRLVRSFSDIQCSSGNSVHSVFWSGDDNFGKKVCDGIYFIYLATKDDKILAKKKTIMIKQEY